MTKCNYQSKYFDYDKNEPSTFDCSEEALATGLCIFHDDKYDNKEELSSSLNEKIKALPKTESLFCIGYKIPSIKIKDSFSRPVYFTRSIINDADFANAKFNKVDFSGAKIQNANFSQTNFDEAYFLAVQFNGKANFSKTIFKNNVSFSESVFKDASFDESVINKAQFLGTKFNSVDFDNSKINDADFFGSKFKDEVRFIGSELTTCRFPSVTFQNKANFSGAKLKKCHFLRSKFMTANFENASLQVVGLRGTLFQGNANFSSAELEKVDFFNATFQKNTNFMEATLQEVIFSAVNFQGAINFTKATFNNEVKFEKIELQEANFSDAKYNDIIYFQDVLFNNQDKVIFDSNDLSKVSFKNTDLTNVRFSERVRWAGKDGFKIVDEELLEESPEQESLEGVISTYRNLRKNYEKRFRNEEADKFRSREIALKKMYKKSQGPLTVSDSELLEHKLDEVNKENEELKKKIDLLEGKTENVSNSNRSKK